MDKHAETLAYSVWQSAYTTGQWPRIHCVKRPIALLRLTIDEAYQTKAFYRNTSYRIWFGPYPWLEVYGQD